MLAVPFLFALIIHGGHIPGAKAGTNNEDAEIDYLIELRGPKPLNAWMEESKNRIFGSFTRDHCEQLYKDLYALGPKNGEINVAAEGPQAAEIYIRMPSDKAKRKAIIDCITKWNLAHQRTAATDEDGKWQVIRFMPYSKPQPM
jgi:hypothetical protein